VGKSGRHSKLVIHFKGAPGNPLSAAEVENKAQKLTHTILSPRQFDRLVYSVANLEKVADVSTLGTLLGNR